MLHLFEQHFRKFVIGRTVRQKRDVMLEVDLLDSLSGLDLLIFGLDAASLNNNTLGFFYLNQVCLHGVGHVQPFYR